MRQIENKSYGEALGKRKMIAANKVMRSAAAEAKRKALAARNAYRASIGLPPVSSPEKRSA